MKESIGLTVTINIIIIFLFVSFIFIIGIVTYSKAYKAASLIVKSLEKYEGYNDLAKAQIDRDLESVGYLRGSSSNCPDSKSVYNVNTEDLVTRGDEQFEYCLYWYDYDESDPDILQNKHYSYGVVTYMNFDAAVFGFKIKLPIYVRTTRIYRFTNT